MSTEETETTSEPAASTAPITDAGATGDGATEPPVNPNLEWFVVHTFSGYENTVRRSLEAALKDPELGQYFGDILVPSEQVIERRGKTTRKTQKKFFPGYIFVHMELSKLAWSLVKNTPKVTGFLGGNTPRPVRPAEMARMLGGAAGGSQVPAEEVETPHVTYVVGDQVRVKSGAFANFQGEVEEVNQDKHKIWLSVSIFGRPTRVEVDFSEVEPVVAS